MLNALPLIPFSTRVRPNQYLLGFNFSFFSIQGEFCHGGCKMTDIVLIHPGNYNVYLKSFSKLNCIVFNYNV